MTTTYYCDLGIPGLTPTLNLFPYPIGLVADTISLTADVNNTGLYIGSSAVVLSNIHRATIVVGSPPAELARGFFDITAGQVNEMFDNLDANDIAGPGGTACTIEIGEANDGDLFGVEVWLSNDQAGTQVVAGPLLTDINGRVTFLLNVGSTYYLWARKDGFNSIQSVPYVASAG